MSLLNDLETGRRVAESRMLDTCSVSREGAESWDEEAGEYTRHSVIVYSGRCRVKQLVNEAKDTDSGSKLLTISALEVHLPVAAEGVRGGDTVLVTGSASRGEQVGRGFKVVGQFDGTQTTALRFRVEAADER